MHEYLKRMRLLADLDDVAVGAEAPDPADVLVWVDTSESPAQVKSWDEATETWVTTIIAGGTPLGGKRHEVLKKFAEVDGAAMWEVVAPFGPEPPTRSHGVGDLWIETDGVDYLD